jgi:isocitrate dehydrogenase
MYWARALANQNTDADLKAVFTPIASALESNESIINGELLAAQGKPMDINGYYFPDEKLASDAMRPSATFNAILAKI